MLKILKKVVILIAGFMFLLFTFTACSDVDSEVDKVQSAPEQSTLVLVESVSVPSTSTLTTSYQIFYDRETKVMYLITYYSDSGCSITIMKNADGSPKLYKGVK